jgi:DNA-binding response OmpR family regulator
MHILIIEDENPLARALKDTLESEGYTTEIAEDGETALERIGVRTPDLILLDLVLPKHDGFEVLETIRKNIEWKNIPVIVLSNLGDKKSIERATQLGSTDYLIKTHHSITEVAAKIKKYLKK